MNAKTIFIRRETHPNEYRTPLVPKDVEKLVGAGYTVYVQRSSDRVYKDAEYETVGAVLTSDEWYTRENALILGIKELGNLEKLQEHSHAYFSHSFKGQKGSDEIIRAFTASKSKLYDFEFFTTEDGKRLISFGWYAGAVGAVLGLQKTFTSLLPWQSIPDMLASVEEAKNGQKVSVAVLGWQGRCGTGVCDILDRFQIVYTRFGKNDDTSNLRDFDIIYNCILLDIHYTKVWFSHSDPAVEHPIRVIDISCDYSRPNNPIAVYNQATSWENPVTSPLENLEIVAIENLPSLLPKESSDHFSSVLTSFLLDRTNAVWERAIKTFYEVTNL